MTNTNEYYKNWDREETSKNAGSPNVSQKSTSKNTKPGNNDQEHRSYSYRNLDDGGDKDPTGNAIEKLHTLHLSINRKK